MFCQLKVLLHLIKQLTRVLLAHGGGHLDPLTREARVCRYDEFPCHGYHSSMQMV